MSSQLQNEFDLITQFYDELHDLQLWMSDTLSMLQLSATAGQTSSANGTTSVSQLRGKHQVHTHTHTHTHTHSHTHTHMTHTHTHTHTPHTHAHTHSRTHTHTHTLARMHTHAHTHTHTNMHTHTFTRTHTHTHAQAIFQQIVTRQPKLISVQSLSEKLILLPSDQSDKQLVDKQVSDLCTQWDDLCKQVG